VAVAIHLSLRFLKAGEPLQRQRPQRRPLHLREYLADLLLGRAMNARVGDRSLPESQVLVLFRETGERAPFQGVVLDVLDARLDLPFVPGRVGLRRQDHRAIVLAEGLHLGRDLGIEPIGMRHRGFEIVDHDLLGHAAKVREGVLQTAEEVFRGLREAGLAVRLAAVREHDPKDVRLTPAAFRRLDPSTCAEVDLAFFARLAFRATEGQPAAAAQPPQEPSHAVITQPRRGAAEVLVDPLG
jgi:hypothetical protein